MHDLLAARDILNTALEYAERSKFKKINNITVELGQTKFSHVHDDGQEHLEEISPENLKFNLSMLAKNTIAESAKIELINSAGDGIKLKEIDGE